MELSTSCLAFALAILTAQQASSPVIDLSTDATELKEAFNKADGRVRLLLFVSPT